MTSLNQPNPSCGGGESFHLPPYSYCIFCLRECSSEEVGSFAAGKTVYVGIERFLGVQFKCSGGGAFSFQFCPDCELLLDRAAELVGKLRRIELELEWKVGKIKDVMVAADRVPSRIKYVKGYHDHHHHHHTEEVVMGKGSEGMKQMQEWRREFVKKCVKRQLRSFPRVKLQKLEEENLVARELLPPMQPLLLENNRSPTRSMSHLTKSTTQEEPRPPVVEPQEECQIASPHLNSAMPAEPDPTTCNNPLLLLNESSEPIFVLKEELVETQQMQNNNNAVVVLPEPRRMEPEQHAASIGGMVTPSTSSSIVIEEDVIPDSLEIAEVKAMMSMECSPDSDSENGDRLEDPLSDTPRQRLEELRLEVAETEKGHLPHRPSYRLLRAQFRCQKCSKTFSSKVKFDSHAESHNLDDDDDEDDDPNLGEEEEGGGQGLSSGSEYDDDHDDDDGHLLTSEESDGNGDDQDESDFKILHVPVSLLNASTTAPPVSQDNLPESSTDTLHPSSEAEDQEEDRCPICKVSFSNYSTLRTHHKRHHEPPSSGKVHRCPVPSCSAYFIRPQQLKAHQVRFHNDDANNRSTSQSTCPICKLSFANPSNLSIHHKSHHELQNLDDPAYGVMQHRCDVDDNVPPTCSAYFRTQLQLEQHKRKIHKIAPQTLSQNEEQPGRAEEGLPKFGESHWCSICKTEYSSASHYKRHFARCHDLGNVDDPDDESVQRCGKPGCSAYFRTSHQLSVHLLRVHGASLHNNKRKYGCSGCEKRFTIKRHLQAHFARFHDVSSRLTKSGREDDDDDDVLRCDQPSCTAYFLQRGQLERHRGVVHGKWFECKDCGKEFRRRNRLNEHRRQVHRLELHLRFRCDDEVDPSSCGKRFETEEELESHKNYWHSVKNAERVKPVKCPKCDKVCRGQDALRVHLSGHDGKRKMSSSSSWICEQCGKAFKFKEGLVRHYKMVHAGADSWEFQCSTCGKKCMTKGRLAEHSRTHTGEKPYTCQHCGMVYAHRHTLRSHVNSKHPGLPPRPIDNKISTSRRGVSKTKKVGGGK